MANGPGGDARPANTLVTSRDGAVLSAAIAAPPMNLLGFELVRDLVSLMQSAEADDSLRVVVFKSADPDYFIVHVDLFRVQAYRAEAAALTGEASRHGELDLGHMVAELAEVRPMKPAETS